MPHFTSEKRTSLTTVCTVLVLITLLTSAIPSHAAGKRNGKKCAKILSLVPHELKTIELLKAEAFILPDEMRGFWSTLDAREQEAVARTISGFWNHQLKSKIPLNDLLAVFVGLMQYTLTGSFDKWPTGWDSKWLNQFLKELSEQPNTTPDVKAKLTSFQFPA
jgi:hypothetical protein